MRHATPTDTSIEARELAKVLGGVAVGALLMYVLDPDRGGQRRASSGKALRSVGARTGSALGSAWHGLGERVKRTQESALDTAESISERVAKSDSASSARAALDDVPAAASHWARSAGALVERLLGGLSMDNASLPKAVSQAARRHSARLEEHVAPEPDDRRTPLALVLGVAGLAGLLWAARGLISEARDALPADATEHQGDEQSARQQAAPQSTASTSPAQSPILH